MAGRQSFILHPSVQDFGAFTDGSLRIIYEGTDFKVTCLKCKKQNILHMILSYYHKNTLISQSSFVLCIFIPLFPWILYTASARIGQASSFCCCFVNELGKGESHAAFTDRFKRHGITGANVSER